MNSANGGKFIVLDVFFRGSSLNYDQGTGNYQPLKKITLWDGRQYTFVSRYAIRYSLLHSQFFKNTLAPGNKLTRAGEGNKKVIQPLPELLITGEILKYPEWDFFGYLVTDTVPQNAREAPVKISHAVSLVPYAYDIHMAGNLDLARRRIQAGDAMDANIFTIEEHHTVYGFTVVIDVNRIGEVEVYLAKGEIKDGNTTMEFNKNKPKIKLEFSSGIEAGKRYSLDEVEMEIDGNKTSFKISDGWIEILSTEKGKSAVKLVFKIPEEKVNNRESEKSEILTKKDRIKNLLEAILNFTRTIKAGAGFSEPPLLVIGKVYTGTYDTYRDRVELLKEYEEEFEEEEIIQDSTKKKVRRYIQRLTSKPKFRLHFDYETVKSAENFVNRIMDAVYGSNIMDRPIVFVREGAVEIAEVGTQ